MDGLSTKDGDAIIDVLEILRGALGDKLTQDDPLAPTQFKPATGALDKVVEELTPLPFSSEDAQQVLTAVDEAIQHENRLAQMTEKGLAVITALRKVVPLLLGG